jgi:hypothetical protein
MLLLMVMKDGAVDAAFARFKAAMSAMPSFEVQVDANDKRGFRITADLIMDGRKHLLYDAMTRAGRYVLTVTPTRFREVDWSTKSYEEFPNEGLVTQVESRQSTLPKTIPYWLKAGTLQSLVPKGGKTVYVGKQVVSGYDCDLIRTNFSNQFGKGMLEFCVANSGLLYRYDSMFEGMQGKQQFEWVLKDYRPLKKISESRFENRIPDGFMPYSLPDRDLPAEIGRKPRMNGWVDPKSGKPWVAPAGHPLLFVVIGRDSSPSQRAMKALAKWKTELQGKDVTVAVASDSVAAAGSMGMLYDPDQKSLKALGAPSTPMFYLLDSAGILRNLWMGLAPGGQAKLHDELVTAISAVK